MVVLGIGAAGLAALPVARLHGRPALRGVSGDPSGIARGTELHGDAGPASIDCWGDSLTEGRGAALGHDFPSLLGFLFDRRANNRGVAGETSAQIRSRMLARPAAEGPERAVIWAGRNDDLSDTAAIESNVEGMVASLPAGSRFLVLGVLNGDMVRERRGGDRYRAIVALNEHLRRRYGGSYVPIRDALVARGRTGDADDRDAAEADVVPPSFRADALHLNGRGQAEVAYAVEDAMRSNGW